MLIRINIHQLQCEMQLKEIQEIQNELSLEKNLDIPISSIIEQIKIFRKGIPSLKLFKPCVIGDGVKLFNDLEKEDYIRRFQSALDEGRVMKFVPASGAASRMFQKQLAAVVKSENSSYKKLSEKAAAGDEDCRAALEFFDNIKSFAFYEELRKTIIDNGRNPDELIEKKNYIDLMKFTAEKEGLNYANLPKGSILFHAYADGARTAFEEHLVEAMNYSAGKNKTVKVHFTISPEYEDEVKKLFSELISKYEKQGWKFDVSFSFQSSETNTVSVTMDNKIFRDVDGKILFRPGGHGALLMNLNRLESDIILIKNIDNIAPDHLKEETYRYKKNLGGYLVYLRHKIFELLLKLDKDHIPESVIDEAVDLIKTEFGLDLSTKLKTKSLDEKKTYLFDFLNRPIRVCGMVKREGHPGGSPFWVEDESGEISKQIVETAQVNLQDKKQAEIFDQATHFNPVDIACSIKDYKGNIFDLKKFVNPNTGLIAIKSKNGRELKALELPGLWNGGMYHWLTVFVEVPKSTFNPVKEINDLLKPEHQPKR
ncbi:MAG: DUF4301 family protein [bacterium]|nr:DUF4301 family protein [bacterium]